MEPLQTNNLQDIHAALDCHGRMPPAKNNHFAYSCERPPTHSLPRLPVGQARLLQSQILQYKHLVRNISEEDGAKTGMQAQHLWSIERQKLIQSSVQRARSKLDKEADLRAMIGGRKDDFIDGDQLKFLVDRRKTEIEVLLQKKDQVSDLTRSRLIIENKFLGVKDFYKGVFSRISEGIKRERRSLTVFSHQLLDRSFFRREKLTKLGDSSSRYSKLEGHVKTDHDRRRKLRHRELMQHLRSHRDEFMEWHRKKGKDRRKVVAQAKATIEARKKEKEEIEEKKKIIRLKELRTYNMEAYIKLVDQEKKAKIKELLGQTNKFLKELGARVLVQKGGNSEQAEENRLNSHEDDNLNEIFQSSNRVYYNLTHTIQEDIKQQPSILCGGQLKGYQVHGLQWLVSLYNNNLNGILADEMGLGKTIQTIGLLCYLIEFKKNTGPFLIVAPLSTISNWMAEFEKWAPSIRKIIYKGNPNTRAQTIKTMRSTKWNVCITTYDFILKDRLKLNKWDWKYIVIDEGHKMKNAKSKFASILGQQYQSDHRLLLTGTPLQNNLQQLWALLNFLLPKVFNSCDDFQKWFSMAIYKNTGDEAVQLDEEEQLLIINRLHQVLRPFLLRRVKKEVYSQLPDKKEHVIKVDMSGWQKFIYDNISKKTALEFASNSGKVSKTTLSNLMMQLRKCCNHPYLFLRNYDDIAYCDWIIRSSGKFELIDRILPKLKEFNHRVLIFTQMTQLMDIMQSYFEYRGVRHLRLDGSTKAEDREERMKLFNEPNSMFDVFLLSTRAGGLGLNLQTADTVIIFDSDWNPQMDLQAQDRVHRIGQEKEVLVLRLITDNSIEEHILERTAFKMNLNELFIQGGLYNLSSSEAERRQKIEDILLKRRANNDENDEDEVLDDDLINQYLRRSQEEYERFTRMDEERYTKEMHLYPPREDKRTHNYRLMRQDQIPSWFIEAPKQIQSNREYGRGYRPRRATNYTDDVTDDQLLGLLDDEDNNGADYSGFEAQKRREREKDRDRDRERDRERERQREREREKEREKEKMDIDQLISKSRAKVEEAFFQDE